MKKMMLKSKYQFKCSKGKLFWTGRAVSGYNTHLFIFNKRQIVKQTLKNSPWVKICTEYWRYKPWIWQGGRAYKEKRLSTMVTLTRDSTVKLDFFSPQSVIVSTAFS